jgi:hypothetical protein
MSKNESKFLNWFLSLCECYRQFLNIKKKYRVIYFKRIVVVYLILVCKLCSARLKILSYAKYRAGHEKVARVRSIA